MSESDDLHSRGKHDFRGRDVAMDVPFHIVVDEIPAHHDEPAALQHRFAVFENGPRHIGKRPDRQKIKLLSVPARGVQNRVYGGFRGRIVGPVLRIVQIGRPLTEPPFILPAVQRRSVSRIYGQLFPVKPEKFFHDARPGLRIPEHGGYAQKPEVLFQGQIERKCVVDIVSDIRIDNIFFHNHLTVRLYPLTEPSITPFVKYFCTKGYTHIMGTSDTTTAAILMDSESAI